MPGRLRLGLREEIVSVASSWVAAERQKRIALNPASSTKGAPERFEWIEADPVLGTDRIGWVTNSWVREDAQKPSLTAVSTSFLDRTQHDHALPPAREHEWSGDRAPNSDRRLSLTSPRSRIESPDIFGGLDATCARSASNETSKHLCQTGLGQWSS